LLSVYSIYLCNIFFCYKCVISLCVIYLCGIYLYVILIICVLYSISMCVISWYVSVNYMSVFKIYLCLKISIWYSLKKYLCDISVCYISVCYIYVWYICVLYNCVLYICVLYICVLYICVLYIFMYNQIFITYWCVVDSSTRCDIFPKSDAVESALPKVKVETLNLTHDVFVNLGGRCDSSASILDIKSASSGITLYSFYRFHKLQLLV